MLTSGLLPVPADPGTLAEGGRRGGVRAGLGASRRRALRPQRECRAAGQKRATPGGFTEAARVRSANPPRL